MARAPGIEPSPYSFGDRRAPSAYRPMRPDRLVTGRAFDHCHQRCQKTLELGPETQKPRIFQSGVSLSLVMDEGLEPDLIPHAGRPLDTEQIGGILMACGIAAKRALRASCQHLPIRGFHGSQS